MQSKRYSIATMVLGLLIFNIACEEELAGPDDDVTPMHLLEGTWELTGLTATYVRDIALPADSAAGDSFSVDAYWDLASIVLGESAALADLHLFAFFEGDTLLDSTVALPTPAHLEALGLEMEVVFKDDGTYTLGGTYPTIRLDEAACRSGLIVAPIVDAGNFTMDYLTGTLGISPDEALGEQAAPIAANVAGERRVAVEHRAVVVHEGSVITRGAIDARYPVHVHVAPGDELLAEVGDLRSHVAEGAAT